MYFVINSIIINTNWTQASGKMKLSSSWLVCPDVIVHCFKGIPYTSFNNCLTLLLCNCSGNIILHDKTRNLGDIHFVIYSKWQFPQHYLLWLVFQVIITEEILDRAYDICVFLLPSCFMKHLTHCTSLSIWASNTLFSHFFSLLPF